MGMRSHFPRHLTMAACLLLSASVDLPADEVYLKDGRVLEGEVVSPPGAAVLDLKVSAAGMLAVQHLDPARVVRVTYGKSARQRDTEALLADRAKLGPDADAAAWWRLAERARALGDQVLARDLASETVARDRDHEEARKLLGMVRFRGVWMRPSEAATARGEVVFRGAFVSWAERERTLADEARRRQEQDVARKDRADQRRAEAAARAPAELYPETDLGYSQPYRSTYWNGYGTPYPGYPGYPPVVVYPPGGYPGGGLPGQPRPPYRPYPPVLRGGSGVAITASGGGSSSAWSFSWNP